MITAVAVTTMKEAQVAAAGAGLKIVELETPHAGPGQGTQARSDFRVTI